MQKMFLTFLILANTLFSQEAKINVAISDLIGQGVEVTSTSIISDRLRTELVKSGQISVLERNAMQDILKEQGFQQTGCTSDACAVQIGQLLGVSKMIVGSVGKLGKLFTLDIRLIDVETGKIQYSESMDCKCQIEEVLTGSVPKIAKKIIDNLNLHQTAKDTVSKTVSSSTQSYGSLLLETSPVGADVILNEKLVGTTPFKSEKLSTGTYNLKLELKSFPALYDTIAIRAGEVFQKQYNLNSGKSERDIRSPMSNGQQGKKKNYTLPISFGLVTIAGAAAVTVGEVMLQREIKENNRLKDEYYNLPAPTTQQQYDTYEGKVKQNADKAKKDQIIRTVGYVAAGIGLVGFTVTLVF